MHKQRIFDYQAMDQGGHEIRGEILADTAEAALAQVRRLGHFPTRIKEKKSAKRNRPRFIPDRLVDELRRSPSFFDPDPKPECTNGREKHREVENGLVIDKEAKRLTYRTNAARGAGVIIDIAVDEEDTLSPIKMAIKCRPQLSLFSRIKDAILTVLRYDTVYNVNVSAETVVTVQKEMQDARPSD